MDGFWGDLFQIIISIVSMAASWVMFRKMGHEGWEGIIPFYNAYVLFDELYGNGWKFLLLLVPFYNIYVAVKLMIDLAHAFNKSTSFGIGLLLVNVVFSCILAFGSAVYKDGSRARTDEDFVESAYDALAAKTGEVYSDAKKKYDEAGGAEGIKDNISARAKDFADDAKEKFNDVKEKAAQPKEDPIAKLKELGDLKEKGVITEEEFNAKKEELLKKI